MTTVHVLTYRTKHDETVLVFETEELALEAAITKIREDCNNGRIDDTDMAIALRILSRCNYFWEEVVRVANKYWSNISEGDHFSIKETEVLYHLSDDKKL